MINKIQPNYNRTSFTAKLNLKGDTSTLPKEFINELENTSKKIGTEQDVIDAYIGSKIIHTDSWRGMGHCYTTIDVCRKSHIKTSINGEKKQKEIITNANDKYEDALELEWRLLGYLKSLISK